MTSELLETLIELEDSWRRGHVWEGDALRFMEVVKKVNEAGGDIDLTVDLGYTTVVARDILVCHADFMKLLGLEETSQQTY